MEVQLPVRIEGLFSGQCLTVVIWKKAEETKLQGQQAPSFPCQTVVLSSYLQKLKLLSSFVHPKSSTLSYLPPNVLSKIFRGFFPLLGICVSEFSISLGATLPVVMLTRLAGTLSRSNGFSNWLMHHPKP